MDIYNFSLEKGIRMVKYIYIEFDMFTGSELVNMYHLFLRDIYCLEKYSPEWIQELFHTWLISVLHERLKLYERCVTIYLYGSLDSDGYMKFPKGFYLHKTYYQNYWRYDIVCPF
jgi:hypothetical protein